MRSRRLAALILGAAASLGVACQLFVTTSDLVPGPSGEGGSDASIADTSDAPTADQGDEGPETPAASYMQVVLADHPSAYWRFDEDGGPVVRDFSGHNLVGAFKQNGSQTPPTFGVQGALANDPDTAITLGNTWFDVGDTFQFGGNAAASFEAWVNAVFDGSNHAILAHRENYLGPHPDQGYTFNVSANQTVVFTRYFDGGYFESATSVPGDLKAGVFSHVVATYDGTTIRIYINGEPRGSAPATTRLGVVLSEFTLGATDNGSAYFFRYTLDEVAVYGYVLPDDVVRKHYQVGIGK